MFVDVGDDDIKPVMDSICWKVNQRFDEADSVAKCGAALVQVTQPLAGHVGVNVAQEVENTATYLPKKGYIKNKLLF